ncbi:galactoside 2-alpha-L-fucosyltransferase-like [Durio zibethinus]|uniref:Fucosyltransferase n=1 Tax=Durio zibethinus TaxID=66656 RepID=A0A6P5Y0A0_DURZI|nr:galactoside 2-alpha-L-fucosyltransferase-like [Durio zibethinus]
MDLNLLRRRSLFSSKSSRSSSRSSGFDAMRFTKSLATFLMALPILIMLTMILRHQPPDRLTGFADARPFSTNVTTPPLLEVDVSQSTDMAKDKLLGGLLASGFDEHSCLSRYESILYRKVSPYQPSAYLVSKLRNYEDLHKRCGPNTQPYNKTVEQLKSGGSVGSTDCKYVVWVCYSGLGNRILTLASVFLYALLTERVLLVDRGKDMADLFCEPFPEKSWFLPPDFPITNKFNSFGPKSPESYGNMLKNNLIKASMESEPSYLYLHLAHDYDDHDKLFFCDDDQALLKKVPWLIVRTDNYFVPSLFLMPSFEHALCMLFPEKETIFHHLGRYLFHPSNHVWGLITRYYKAYLSKADERVGIQVRIFDKGPGPYQYVKNQISACTLGEKLLPEVDIKGSINVTPSENSKVKAVLMTSLVSGYFENVRNMYWEHPTVNGDIIGVYQPSHEEQQQTEKRLHNMKAWAEMYLLSLTDVLVTSAWSTFGYVAQGLGGLKPWILYKSENQTTPNPPCQRAVSMEPCFHAPPFYDCKAKKGIDTGKVVPHVRHCEDISWGLKVVDSHAEL